MNRRKLIKQLALIPITLGAMKLSKLKNITDEFGHTKKMPVLFIGHGHPMNAILDNDFTQSLANLGQSLIKPNAVLVVSAHWETKGTFVSTNPNPKTIYDFGRFDDRLFQVKYEPRGHPQLAREVRETVTGIDILEHPAMGLDHGAWTVLKYIFPKADVPVFEMSMDYTKPSEFHYKLGKELRSLRQKGVMILCSGNIVHNLGSLDWSNINAKAFDWNIEFDELVKTKISTQDFQSLINYQNLGTAARLSAPTPDHYNPMMYSLGLIEKHEQVRYLYEGYQYGGISMRCFQVG